MTSVYVGEGGGGGGGGERERGTGGEGGKGMGSIMPGTTVPTSGNLTRTHISHVCNTHVTCISHVCHMRVALHITCM